MRAQLYNDPTKCVDEALDGLIKLSNGSLRLLQPRVVVRNSIDRTKTTLISLGGSGHEPAHAGFVGSGMLTAAVCGNVFASPPASDILAALLHISGTNGTIIILKNYTGDVVNSKIAKERAELEYGLKNIHIVIAADDCATRSTTGTGARGLAGTLFYHKLAGGMAEAGHGAAEIVEALSSLKTRVATMGLSFNTCALPGQSSITKEIEFGKAELGLGIHGEAGVRHLEKAPSSSQAMKMLVEATTEGGERFATKNVALILNNLGGLSNLEMLVAAKDAFDLLESKHFQVQYCISGALMTSLDSAGFSLSLLHDVSEKELSLMRSPTSALGWPFSSMSSSITTQTPEAIDEGLTMHKRIKTNTSSPKFNESWIEKIRAACTVMKSQPVIDQLNKLDSLAGDGDTGISLSRCADLLSAAVQNDKPETVNDFLNLILHVCEATGGSFGGIMSLFFKGCADFAEHEASTFSWGAAFDKGLESLVKNGAAKVGDRSFVDALIPALKHHQSLKDAIGAAREGANSTSSLTAKVGRACYVPKEKYLGSNDAGAEAVAIFLDALGK